MYVRRKYVHLTRSEFSLYITLLPGPSHSSPHRKPSSTSPSLSPYSSFVLFFPMRREPILDNGPYTMGNSVSTDMFESGVSPANRRSRRFSAWEAETILPDCRVFVYKFSSTDEVACLLIVSKKSATSVWWETLWLEPPTVLHKCNECAFRRNMDLLIPSVLYRYFQGISALMTLIFWFESCHVLLLTKKK